MKMRAFVGVATAAGLMLVTPAAASAAGSGPEVPPDGYVTHSDPDASNCFVNVDGPHYSAGAGGVIAKVRFSCGTLVSRKVTSWLGNLYRCPTKPPAGSTESSWTNQYGCRVVRSASETADFTIPKGGTVTRYIPNSSQTGAPSGAYFVACVRGYWSNGSTFAKASVIQYA